MRESENEERNRESDPLTETQPDPPVTYAVETEFLRSVAPRPRQEWGRLAKAFVWERFQQEGGPFLRRLASAASGERHLKRQPTALLYTFMRHNRARFLEMSAQEAIELLRKEGFEPGGVKWYGKHRLKAIGRLRNARNK
jgi:hypothetical protein